jgi:hypothetical protein
LRWVVMHASEDVWELRCGLVRRVRFPRRVGVSFARSRLVCRQVLVYVQPESGVVMRRSCSPMCTSALLAGHTLTPLPGAPRVPSRNSAGQSCALHDPVHAYESVWRSP